MNKYDPLERFLRSRGERSITLSFQQVETIIHDRLPPSSFKYEAHWRGTSPGRPGGAIADAGWAVDRIDWLSSSIVLLRDSARR